MASIHIPLDFPREKLGLCMIVKNEERALARCLESVRDWVGEMVVVDTGSTDNTVNIAVSYGARVSHFAWCDDFSAARNAALDQATCEWILVLDGDEFLHVEDPEKLAQALQQSRFDGFSVPIRSVNDDGTYSKAMVFRLFRRSQPGIRYRGEVHEQLQAVASGELHTSSLACVSIDHDGYTAAVVASADKARRNVRLSHKLTQSRPQDPFSWFVHAMALTQSDPDGMLDAAEKAVALFEADSSRIRGEHYVVNLYLALINAHQSRGSIARALALSDRALEIFPDSPDLNYRRGVVRIEKGDFAAAVDDLVCALGPRASAFGLLVDPAATGHGARTALAHAMRQLGRVDDAVAQLHLAIDQAPTEYANAHAEMGTLLMERGALDQAVHFFEEAGRRNKSPSGVALQLGWCLYKLNRFDRAEDVLRSHAGDPQMDLLLARLWLETGKANQALALLLANSLPAALLPLGWAYFVLGNTAHAASAWDTWLKQASVENDVKSALLLFRSLIVENLAEPAQSQCSAGAPREMDGWVLLLLRYGLNACVDRLVSRSRLVMGAHWPGVRMRWAQAMVVAEFVDAGMALLLEAAQEAPEDSAVYYWLGYCAVLRQQTEDARVLFEECLRLDPQHPQARQALAIL